MSSSNNDVPAARYLREVLNDLLRHMVQQPDALKVEVITMPQGYDLSIVAAGKDVGRVVGSSGSRFKALRNLVREYGRNVGQKYHLRRLPDFKDVPKTGKITNQQIKLKDSALVDVVKKLAANLTSAMAVRSQEVWVQDEVLLDGEILLTIHISDREPKHLQNVMGDTVGLLVEAVGLINKRTVRTCFVVDPAQPQTADGRYAHET